MQEAELSDDPVAEIRAKWRRRIRNQSLLGVAVLLVLAGVIGAARGIELRRDKAAVGRLTHDREHCESALVDVAHGQQRIVSWGSIPAESVNLALAGRVGAPESPWLEVAYPERTRLTLCTANSSGSGFAPETRFVTDGRGRVLVLPTDVDL